MATRAWLLAPSVTLFAITAAAFYILHGRRRQLKEQKSAAAPPAQQSAPAPPAQQSAAAPPAQQSAATLPAMTAVRIAADVSEAGTSMGMLAADRLAAGAPMPLSDVTMDALRGSGDVWVLLVDTDKEGDSPAARRLTKSLRAHRQSSPEDMAPPLTGVRVAVLTLAHSVCAFSAASGGAEKYRAGQRLQAALIACGADITVAHGMAEVEVQEVEESVLPWLEGLRIAITPPR